jgi:hypothetical protein
METIMEETRATFLSTILGWAKSNHLILLAGALTTIFGLIGSANSAVPVVLKAFNVPACYTYATLYRGAGSYFQHEGAVWREYPPEGGAYRFEFKEIERTRDQISLLNLTPRENMKDWQTLMVRLPVCGGTAKLYVGMPERSSNLEEVWRE